MRDCDSCVYHTSGTCSKWECNFTTIEDVKKQAVAEFVDGLSNARELAESHQKKTFLQDFREKYPNAPLSSRDGTPAICPDVLGYDGEKCYCGKNGCKDCWNREVEA